MAAFNQEPNPIDPNYLGYSRGTQGAHIASLPEPVGLRKGTEVQYQANKSGAAAIGAVAEALGPIASGLKTAYLEGAKTAVDNEIGGIRDQFNQDLDKAISGGGVKVPKVMAYADESEDNGSSSAIPDEIEASGTMLSKLATARAGKYMTEREYAIATESKLQELRERYPGYTDEIDHMVKSKLGFDPANMRWQASLNALTSMAQAAQAGSNAAQKAIDNDLKHVGPAEQDDFYKTGDTKLLHMRSMRNQGNAFTLTQSRAAFDYNKDTEAYGKQNDKEMAAKVLFLEATQQSENAVNQIRAASGTAVNKIFESIRSGGPEPTDAEWKPAIQQMMAVKAKHDQDMLALRNAYVNGKYGPTYGQTMDPKDFTETLKQASEPMERLYNDIVGKNFTALKADGEIYQKVFDRDKLNVVSGDTFSKRLFVASKELGPNAVADMLSNNPNYLGRFGQGYTGALLSGEVAGAGDAAKKLNVTTPAEHRMLIEQPILNILNPNTPPAGVINQTKTFFNQDTFRYISNMKPGDREYTFGQMVNPQVADAILKTKDPQAIAQYSDFAKRYFFLQSRSDLATMEQAAQSGLVEFKYNPTNNSMEVGLSQKGKDRHLEAIGEPKVATDRMNLRLKSIEPVLKHEGDVGAGSLQLLGVSGFRSILKSHMEKHSELGVQQAPDGNWYLPDPKRPGKYLQVELG